MTTKIISKGGGKVIREFDSVATAMEKIAALEARQWRPMRELAIDPQNVQATARLQEIDAEIAALRADLSERED